MPRPNNKGDLLSQSDKSYRALLALIDSIPKEMQEKDFSLNGRDKNIRDVLCHLHEWHCMMERWHEDDKKGRTPVVPAEGYTWKTYPELNREIWKKYQKTRLDESRKLFAMSHKKMTSLIKSHTNEEMFSTKVYAWTNSTTLGSYFVSVTSSHYDWAIKTLKAIGKGIP